MFIRGRIQRHEDIIHLVTDRLEDLSYWLNRLADMGADETSEMTLPLASADEVIRTLPAGIRAVIRAPSASFPNPGIFIRLRAANRPLRHSIACHVRINVPCAEPNSPAKRGHDPTSYPRRMLARRAP